MLRKYLAKAQKEKWAIGQFHISNLEILKAIVKAAEVLKSPVIIGTSEGESKFLGLEQAVAAIKAFRQATGLPIFLNLDHGKTFAYIKKALSVGYDTVHFDGSSLSLSKNIEITKKIVKLAHQKKISVEGEVGIIGGELTNPEDADKFIQETKVDRLAVNVGSRHGMEKKGGEHINFQRLEEIKRKVRDKAFLVLHGGSGVPEKEIKTAIRLGIVKININTELRMVYTNTLRRTLKKKENVPYKYMPKVITALQEVVEEKIKLFGSDNKV